MGSPVPYRHHTTPDRRNHWIEPIRRDLEPAPSANPHYERGVQWGISTRHREITDREAHSWGPNPPDPLHVHHTHTIARVAMPPTAFAALTALILVLLLAAVAGYVADPTWIPTGRLVAAIIVGFFGLIVGTVGFFASSSAREQQHRHGHR